MTDQSITDAWQGKPVANTRNPARGIILTIPQMAQFLGCSSKHVRELVESGAPVYERGGRGGNPHKLNSYEFMNWRDAWRDSQKIGRPKGPVDETKARIQNAAAEIKELELAEKRGDLFHLSDWGPFICDRLVVARTELCQISAQFREEFSEP